jgi:serine/threonine protein kinase
MELVSGPPLTEYARAHQLSIAERVALLMKLADAVQHAHLRGIIHRDLKPANVLIAEGGQPKVLDFGIARATGGHLDNVQRITTQTAHGQLMGTLAYMSPEQLRAAPDDIDARCDVYALGVLMYRLLCGRLPFNLSGVPVAEAIRRVLEDAPTPLGLVDADLRGPLEQIVGRAMARDRARRYRSAADLATDLRSFVEGRPVSVSREATPHTSAIRRGGRRMPAISAAVVTVAMFAALALVEHRRANDLASRSPRAVALSPDGARVAVISASGIQVFNARTGRVDRTVSSDSRWTAIAFAADGAHLTAIADDGSSQVFDAGPGPAPPTR